MLPGNISRLGSIRILMKFLWLLILTIYYNFERIVGKDNLNATI